MEIDLTGHANLSTGQYSTPLHSKNATKMRQRKIVHEDTGVHIFCYLVQIVSLIFSLSIQDEKYFIMVDSLTLHLPNQVPFE